MMWAPNLAEPSPVFIKPIIDNALTLVQENFKQALDHYFSSSHYDDFREYSKGMVKGISFPCFAIQPRGADTLLSDDGSHIIVVASFESLIGVTGNNDSEVTDAIENYAGVLDAVYRTSRKSLCNGISNAFEVNVQINHEFGPRGMNKEQTLIFRSAFIETQVSFRQR